MKSAAFESYGKRLQDFYRLMGIHLEDIQTIFSDFIDSTMGSAQKLNESAAKHRAEAEASIENAHFAADAETEEKIAGVQASVDDIFDSAMSGEVDSNSSDESDAARRASGRFSKNAEAVMLLEEQLGNILMGVVGSLSNDDVIKQITNNLLKSLEHTQTGITDTFTNIGESNQVELITGFQAALLEKNKSLYCTTEESQNHDKILGETAAFSGDAGSIRQFFYDLATVNKIAKLQVSSIHSIISDTMQQTMEKVYDIDSSVTKNKQHADAAIVKKEDGEFVNVSMNQLDEQVGGKVELSDMLKKTAEKLGSMDSELGDFMTKLMGDLSIFDVIHQRLENCMKAFDTFGETLTEIGEFDQGVPDIDKMLRDKIVFIGNMSKSTEEQQRFEEIFKAA